MNKSDFVNHHGIIFNPSQLKNIMGVGVSAWDRLGLEQIITDYKVIFCSENRENLLFEKHLFKTGEKLKLKQINTLGLLNNKVIRSAIKNTQCSLLIYKNSLNIAKVCHKLPVKLLAPLVELTTKFENKAEFRRIMSRLGLPFPEFIIKKTTEINSLLYKSLVKKYGKLVLQEEISNGGRGTYFVENFDQFESAMHKIRQANCNSVVISKFIEGKVVSIQACVTKSGVYFSPIQKQITNDPNLCYLAKQKSEKFAGGEWGYIKYSNKTKLQLAQVMTVLSKELSQQGYQGILGLDFIIDEKDRVFLLEMNSRLTGFTAPLSMLLNRAGIFSLLLLHVLELSGVKYKIDRALVKNSMMGRIKGGYLILHNIKESSVKLSEKLKAGVYILSQKELIFQRPGYSYEHLKNRKEFILTNMQEHDISIAPGRRMLRILTLDRVLNGNSINRKYSRLIELIQENLSDFNLIDKPAPEPV